MTRSASHIRLFQAAAAVLVVACWFSLTSISYAQQGGATETDAAESMGVGMKSRFASGATPIEIQRTQIIPGTPMSVNSTMSNILTSNRGGAFGGILARYDTTTFGKFFGTGELPQRTISQRIQELEALDQGDNTVENVEIDRMYPPRLVVDFNELPTRSLKSAASRANMTTQIENVLSRFEFDPHRESVRVEMLGGKLILRGAVQSTRLSQLIANVLSMQPGVDEVDNQLIVLAPDANNVDLFGRPISTER